MDGEVASAELELIDRETAVAFRPSVADATVSLNGTSSARGVGPLTLLPRLDQSGIHSARSAQGIHSGRIKKVDLTTLPRPHRDARRRTAEQALLHALAGLNDGRGGSQTGYEGLKPGGGPSRSASASRRQTKDSNNWQGMSQVLHDAPASARSRPASSRVHLPTPNEPNGTLSSRIHHPTAILEDLPKSPSMPAASEPVVDANHEQLDPLPISSLPHSVDPPVERIELINPHDDEEAKRASPNAPDENVNAVKELIAQHPSLKLDSSSDDENDEDAAPRPILRTRTTVDPTPIKAARAKGASSSSSSSDDDSSDAKSTAPITRTRTSFTAPKGGSTVPPARRFSEQRMGGGPGGVGLIKPQPRKHSVLIPLGRSAHSAMNPTTGGAPNSAGGPTQKALSVIHSGLLPGHALSQNPSSNDRPSVVSSVGSRESDDASRSCMPGVGVDGGVAGGVGGVGDGDGGGDGGSVSRVNKIESNQEIDGMDEFAEKEEAALANESEEEEKEESEISPLGQKVLGAIESIPGTILMTLATVYCLFGDSIRVAALPPSVDNTFVGLSVTCLVLFFLEFMCFCIWKPKYCLSFFFFLDLVAVLSLIPEIPFMWEPIMHGFGVQAESEGGAISSANLVAVRAGRASRAGTRAGRLLRFTRLVRFLRVAKLYKYVEDEDESEEERLEREKAEGNNEDGNGNGNGIGGAVSQTGGSHAEVDALLDDPIVEESVSKKGSHSARSSTSNADDDDAWSLEDDSDSQIGAGVTDFITKVVILTVLTLLFVLPLLLADQEDSTPDAFSFQIDSLVERAAASSSSNDGDDSSLQLLQTVIDDWINTRETLLLLQIAHPAFASISLAAEESGELDYNSIYPLESLGLRTDQLLTNYVDEYGIDRLRANEIKKTHSTHLCLWMSIKTDKEDTALFGIGTTLVVTILIAGASALFSKDASDLVLDPIENMFRFVTTLAKNPLAKIQLGSDGTRKGGGSGSGGSGGGSKPLETQLLEDTFCKLAGLLQIGFGAAGAEVISHNMHGDFLDPLVPGRKVFAIFGFADIRRFAPLTEALSESVMAFANQVASVVHEAAHKGGGGSNKNLGNAFLMVWKPTNAAIRRASQVASQAAMDAVEAHRKKLADEEAKLKAQLASGIASLPSDGSGALNPVTGSPIVSPSGAATQPTESELSSAAFHARMHPADVGTISNTHGTTNLTTMTMLRDNRMTDSPLTAGGHPMAESRRSLFQSSGTGTSEDPFLHHMSPQPHRGSITIDRRGGTSSAPPESLTPTTANRPSPLHFQFRSSISQGQGALLPASEPAAGDVPVVTPVGGGLSVTGDSAATTPAFGSASPTTPGMPFGRRPSNLRMNKRPSVGNVQWAELTTGAAPFALPSPTIPIRPTPTDEHTNMAEVELASNTNPTGVTSSPHVTPQIVSPKFGSPLAFTGARRLSGAVASQLPIPAPIAEAVDVSASPPPDGRSNMLGSPSYTTRHMRRDEIGLATMSNHAIESRSGITGTSVNQVSSTGRSSMSDNDDSSLLGGGASGAPSHVAPSLDRRVSAGVNASGGPVWDTMKALADQALVAFLQTAVTVANSREFDKWRHHPALARNEAVLGRTLKESETSKYEIDMGFGLHVGWAIEGAIGSIHKIDASYLSPNVNIASRLDGATKQYGVKLLMSGPFVSLLHTEIRTRCRHIDRITVKGSKLPLDIWTFDIDVKTRKQMIDEANQRQDESHTNESSKVSKVISKSSAPASSSTHPSSSNADPLHDMISSIPRGGLKLTDAALSSAAVDSNANGNDGAGANVNATRSKPSKGVLKLGTAVANFGQSVINGIANIAHKKNQVGILEQSATQPNQIDATSSSSPTIVVDTVSTVPPSSVVVESASDLVSPASPFPSPAELIQVAPAPTEVTQPAATEDAPHPNAMPNNTDQIDHRPNSDVQSLAVPATPTTPLVKGVASPASPAVPSTPQSALCARLQTGLPETFVPLSNKATRAYLRGHWSRARDILEQRVLPLRPDDKPALKLLGFLKEHNFKAPKNWPGYKKLTDK